jgi:hypothetical protein
MRTLVIATALAAAVGAGVSEADWGSFVSSFKAPGAWPSGIWCRPGELYVSVHAGTVFRMTTTGSVTKYYPTGLQYLAGLTGGTVGSTTYYWVGTTDPAYVYRFIDNSSTIDGSFPVPGSPPTWRGLGFADASHLYYSDQASRTLYVIHPMTGSVYGSYKLDFKPNDVDYDPAGSGHLWIASGADRAVYKCTLTGSPLASFKTVFPEPHWPQGCGFAGDYLWVGDGDPTKGWNIVVQYDIRSEPAVAPASLGRIKALYE